MSYMYPFPRDTRVSQKFGANATQYNLSGKHTGEDAAVPVGTPVHAAGDGKIVAAGYFPNYNNEWLYGPMGGLTLVLDCGAAEPTFGYAHLSQVLVKEGDYVRKGQVVALSGMSGAATGPHAHTEALPPNWNTHNGTYGRVDPRIYMTEFPGEVTAQGSIAPEEDDMALFADREAFKAAVVEAMFGARFDTLNEKNQATGTITLRDFLQYYPANVALDRKQLAEGLTASVTSVVKAVKAGQAVDPAVVAREIAAQLDGITLKVVTEGAG